MPAHTQFPEIDKRRLTIAAEAAIKRWTEHCGEGALSHQLRMGEVITVDFLRGWLGRWMLARANPIYLRRQLAEQLTQIRPQLMNAEEGQLPGLVSQLANMLAHNGATRGRQTSLLSKFAFSLRPEVIVPYDTRARMALTNMSRDRLREHDYVTYLTMFGHYSGHVAQHLDTNNITNNLRGRWQNTMNERLFKRRTADKFLMLLGGFNEARI